MDVSFDTLETISSSEFRKVLSPRQRVGVFNAQPSRHVRSQDDQACLRGSSVTWDSQAGHLNALFPPKKPGKIVRMDQWTSA